VIGVRRLAGEIGVMIALAVILAAVGAMGTFDQPIGSRLVTWLVLALGGYACFRPVIGVGTWLSRRAALPVYPMIALASILATLPATFVVAALEGNRIRSASVGELANLFLYVLLIGGIATVIQVLVRRSIEARAGAPAAVPAAALASAASIEDEPAEQIITAPAASSPFLDQIPAAIAQGLLYIGNEDHYVRAYSSAGEAMVLARMRDVVAGLGGIDGARVHRSWWVARAAVAGVIRKDRAVYLRLVDGREVPVARSAMAELKADGWI
jgi:hypothetical protein